jgi:glycosyltransferase involved in cell wall biosynthesis
VRVLIVSRASYPLPASQGGTDAYSLRTATFLIPQGHEVFLVGQGRPGPAFGDVQFVRVPANVPVTSRFRLTYYLKGFFLNLASVLTAIRFLRRRGAEIDVIHSNSNLGVLILKQLFPEKPMVYTLHDPLVRPHAKRSLLDRIVRPINNGLLERLALRRADHIVAVSSEIRAQVESVIGPNTKSTLLYPFMRPQSAGAEALGRTWGRPVSGPYALSVGAQTGRKRFDLLIRAIARTRTPIELVLVGTGSDRSRLVRTARDVGVSHRVTFFDHVTEEEIGALFRGATVYAMASEREGFPTSLMEAALSGTPTLYFTDAPVGDVDNFQSDFFRVIHALSEEEIANAINWVCSRSVGGAVDRRGIASWARSAFPSPEFVASELGRIYAEAAEAA